MPSLQPANPVSCTWETSFPFNLRSHTSSLFLSCLPRFHVEMCVKVSEWIAKPLLFCYFLNFLFLFQTVFNFSDCTFVLCDVLAFELLSTDEWKLFWALKMLSLISLPMVKWNIMAVVGGDTTHWYNFWVESVECYISTLNWSFYR